MSKKYKGPEKAAILLMTLGEEMAALVLAKMNDREIQTLGNYMAALGDVDEEVMDSVKKEFYEMIEMGGGGLGLGGLDFLKNALLQAMDPAKATEILNNITKKRIKGKSMRTASEAEVKKSFTRSKSFNVLLKPPTEWLKFRE